MATNLVMPTKKTPLGIYVTLIGLAVLGCIIFYWLIGVLGISILCFCLAFMTRVYTKGVAGFHASVLLNHFSGNQRTVFQGVNLKLPWESCTQTVDLRVDLKEVREETYPSRDALMKAKYVYTIRPDVSGGDAGEKVILYASYETDAIRLSARALFSMLLSDYFGEHHGQELLNKDLINRETFENNPGRDHIHDFERDHGVNVTVRLENSNFSDATQAARDTMSIALSFTIAVNNLIAGGMSRSEAEKTAKLMNLPGVKEYYVNLDARGLGN